MLEIEDFEQGKKFYNTRTNIYHEIIKVEGGEVFSVWAKPSFKSDPLIWFVDENRWGWSSVDEILQLREVDNMEMENTKRHPQADLIHAWAEGAKIQFLDLNSSDKWEDCVEPFWSNDVEYRIKPKTVMKRFCNGVELDDCVTNPLIYGTRYFIASYYGLSVNAMGFSWQGSPQEIDWLKCGITYLTEDSAIKHIKAMLITETKEVEV